MYKLLSILIMVISFSAKAQKTPGKYFNPDTQPIPGAVSKTPELPGINKLSWKADEPKTFELVDGAVVRTLSPDNMPCLVPNKLYTYAISNAFSPYQGIPYMPNSIRIQKKSSTR